MPTNKHKRKASAHAKVIKNVKASGLVTSHPKLFVLGGLFFVALGIYLLVFESENSAMFGFAMLSLITGIATTIYANFAVPEPKKK